MISRGFGIGNFSAPFRSPRAVKALMTPCLMSAVFGSWSQPASMVMPRPPCEAV